MESLTARDPPNAPIYPPIHAPIRAWYVVRGARGVSVDERERMSLDL
jgi:hypothetical protein